LDENEVARLKETIRQLRPLRGIPLKLVIEALSDCKIIPYDDNDERDRKLLEDLKLVASAAGQSVNREPILRPRANEVGNGIEPYVKAALHNAGCAAATPSCRSGQRKSTGYPDIELVDAFGRTSYLECKTYNIENIATTQRSFYLSPSEDCKITKAGHPDEYSDVDIIVVSPQSEGASFFERRGRFRKVTGAADDPNAEAVDALCYTPEEFAELRSGPTMIREAVERGIRVA